MLYQEYKAEYLAAYIDSGAGICTAKKGVFPDNIVDNLPQITGRDFSKKILLLSKGVKEAEILIGGAGQTPWYKVKTPPIYFHDTGADILLGNNFLQMFKKYEQDNEQRRLVFTTLCDHKIIVQRLKEAFNRKMPLNFRSKRGDGGVIRHPKMKDQRRFNEALLMCRTGELAEDLGDEEVQILKTSLISHQDIKEEVKVSLEDVQRRIRRCYNENPLAWWDRNQLKATLKLKKDKEYEFVRFRPILMNITDQRDMRQIIQEHLDLKLIEAGDSPYSSPGFLVRNHGEIKRGKPRLVINYKGINDILEFDGYFIPSRDHLINCIRNAKVFSKFDCKSGFYQIRMEEGSKKFTAFSTPQGHYVWNVMPMGLANAPQIFQRKMDNLFKDYFSFMFVYIDDVLIASKDMEEHNKHLQIFADVCFKEGLVLSEKKAVVATRKIEFLGIEIDESGMIMQDHIVEKVQNFPEDLKEKKQLQSFLGVVNFAGMFIKDLAKFRQIFSPLLKKDAPFIWKDEHREGMKQLKEICKSLPKLSIPQDEDDLILYTDASDYWWAAVLNKITPYGEEPCRYCSGLFSDEEKNRWHINDKEFYAVRRAFKKWPIFLLAKKFTLKVDNTNVKAFLKNKIESKPENARRLRWQAECQYYVYDIVVLKSHENVLADFLTRDGVQRD